MAIWALVTGASEGLGREFAILAAQSGFDVILTARNEEKLQRLAHELHRAYHVAVAVIPADLANPAEAERLWTEAARGREIGVFVNNAGLGHIGPFAEPAGWQREADSVAVNVVAATLLLKAAVAHMAETGSGHILNVASVAGAMPGPQMAVYHATKAYLLSLSEALASELKGSGIRVTALCPGATETAFFTAEGAERSTLLTRLLPMANAAKVAQAGWQGMEKGRRIVVPGVLNKIAFAMPRFLPRRMVTGLMGMVLRRRW